MQFGFNEAKKNIHNFSFDEDSHNDMKFKIQIENSESVDYKRINYINYQNKEKEIEECIKTIFPFNEEKKENDELIEEKNNILFNKIKLKKKRGRKTQNFIKNKKFHSASDFDNTTRKIQIHFLNFIISLLNDIAFYFLQNKKPLFKKFDYCQKRKVDFQTIKVLKGLNIKKLIERFNICSKYKLNNKKNINEQNLALLCKYPGCNHFIKQNFLKVFKMYYNNKERLRTILIDGKEIFLSEKTKDFSCLLKDNKEYEDELIKTVELVYLYQNVLNVSKNIEDEA